MKHVPLQSKLPKYNRHLSEEGQRIQQPIKQQRILVQPNQNIIVDKFNTRIK